MEKLDIKHLLNKYKPRTWAKPGVITCSTCGDTGWIMVEGRNRRCDCLIEKIKNSKRECLPIQFRHISYDKISRQTFGITGKHRVIIPNAVKDHKGGVILVGKPSTCKTSLLCAQINAMIDRGFIDVFYVTEFQLLNDLRGVAYKEDYKSVTPLWQISQGGPFHLAIDDVGVTPRTPDRASLFYDFINQAALNKTSLSVATKFSIYELESAWSNAGVTGITSRFKSLMKWISLE